MGEPLLGGNIGDVRFSRPCQSRVKITGCGGYTGFVWIIDWHYRMHYEPFKVRIETIFDAKKSIFLSVLERIIFLLELIYRNLTDSRTFHISSRQNSDSNTKCLASRCFFIQETRFVNQKHFFLNQEMIFLNQLFCYLYREMTFLYQEVVCVNQEYFFSNKESFFLKSRIFFSWINKLLCLIQKLSVWIQKIFSWIKILTFMN